MAMSAGARARLLMLLVAVLAGCGGGEVARAQEPDGVRSEVREQLGDVPAALDTATASRLSGAFRAAADRALPAVVYIRVQQKAQVVRRNAVPEPFRRMFPDFFREDRTERLPPQRGQGSGFLFHEDGYILTNRHVVEDAEQVVVTLVDGREYEAEVVGADPNTDVAVIRIRPREGEALPVAELGDSDRVRVGDWVLALGNPLGLNFTVTAGIVSARGRSIGILQQPQALEAFIQTDAAINPGNSGGPLVDLLGRVVGVNTAISSPTGVYTGYGFAIPINLARRVADDLIRYGVVQRPRLGVLIQSPDAADAEVYGLERPMGAEVTQVQPGTPAARAGLEMGDVIVALNGEPIETATDLTTRLARLRPGDRVDLDVVRYGRRLEFEVELGQFETAEPETAERDDRPDAEARLGFSVSPLTPALADRLRLPRDEGVIVADVPALSPAGDAGVRQGMQILRINGEEVRTPADVERVAEALEPGSVVSLVVRLPEDQGEMIINYRTRR